MAMFSFYSPPLYCIYLVPPVQKEASCSIRLGRPFNLVRNNWVWLDPGAMYSYYLHEKKQRNYDYKLQGNVRPFS